jgi:flagellar biogenesis protein FliO
VPGAKSQSQVPPHKHKLAQVSADDSLARINTERVNIRKGAGDEFVRFTLLDKEARVKTIGSQGEWVHVVLPNGNDGWLRRRYVDLPLVSAVSTKSSPKPSSTTIAVSPSPTAPKAVQIAASLSNTPVAGIEKTPGTTRNPTSPPATTASNAAILKQSKSSAPAPIKSNSALPSSKTGQAGSTSDLLAGTKPDPAEKTQESPAEAMRDGWKLMLYLVPMLALIVLAIRGLKAIQQKTGWLPGVKRGLIGSLNLTNARKSGGSSIRVMESVPLGTVGLHLVEVKGRVLLLGTSGASISVLTEVKDAENLNHAEFKAILNAAAEELGGKDAGEAGLSSLVGNLDDSLRETRELIAKRTAAVRHWSEM